MAHDQNKFDLAEMQAAAARACALLKVLGNPDRLMLLCQLTQGEFCVSELETLLGIQQPTLSQQLGVLREEKLVNTRREGKQIYYSLASKEASAVLQVLYQQFCTPTQAGNDAH
ncbi:ArsR/SmtB family transcription factor [Massilia norwichensis]|uniref:Metalloregulator ArsR/SmtB family transcription factor n=1 Tax=Massilia norwichensis TaxID=1442366 RepID=A0ABT2A648_9BURK|nr:metalloregulator ArsR/SmtB family transcription factor [Massilia norwichensis]MCS0589667.1 metalloregulator ArsR/SmtB family transcription factor [Massilia norwichensis]